MTTNVYDGFSGVMATDSRWSRILPNAFIFVDESNFEKIMIAGKLSFMFAGDMKMIYDWKDWGKNSPKISNMPLVNENIAVCIVDSETNVIIYEYGQEVRNNARFAGSGYTHALSCWETNKSAIRAVETAKVFDFRSGGAVKYFDFINKKHNISEGSSLSYDDAMKQMKERGKVMIFSPNNQSTVVDLKDCTDPMVQGFVSDVAAGNATLEAPFTAAASWSPDDAQKLKQALSSYFPE